MEVPAGFYQIGADIPAGRWTITPAADVRFNLCYADKANASLSDIGSGWDGVNGWNGVLSSKKNTDGTWRDPEYFHSVVLEPGEDMKFAAPTHPQTGFNVFMRSMCEQVGACLEIPADLLLMSFNSSYSASRAALLEAWKAFRMRREWIADDFCKPVYEIWLTEAVARGRISAPGFLTDPIIRQAYLGSEWIGPSQGQLDPTKEVAAAVTAIQHI